MFSDFSGTNRESWKFTYTGSQLVKAAKVKHDTYLKKEDVARKRITSLIANPNIACDSQDVTDAKNEAQRSGKIREQCMVFIHEFARTPKKEYHLAIGDVVFFDLVLLGIE